MDGDEGRRHLPLLVPSALAKGRGRFAFLPRVTLNSVTAYLQTTRAQAVARARTEGRYESRREVVVVTDTAHRGGQRLQLVSPDGAATLVDADRLTIEARRRLFLKTPAGFEPLSLSPTTGSCPPSPPGRSESDVRAIGIRLSKTYVRGSGPLIVGRLGADRWSAR